MFRGVISVRHNNPDLVVAKIPIKERENSTQLADCGIDYFEGGLCYTIFRGKQTSVCKKWL